MKKFKTLLFVVSALASTHASAAILLSNVNVDRNNYGDGSLGYMFTSTSASTVINFLGYNDADSDGLLASHVVSLWTLNSGVGVPAFTYDFVTSVTIPAATVATLDGGYRWQSIAPVTLSNTVADGYIVMAETIFGGDKWGDNVSATFDTSIGTLGSFGLVSPNFTLGSPHNFNGELNASGGYVYNGGNIATSVIPEPSAALLGGLGMLCMLRRRR